MARESGPSIPLWLMLSTSAITLTPGSCDGFAGRRRRQLAGVVAVTLDDLARVDQDVAVAGERDRMEPQRPAGPIAGIRRRYALPVIGSVVVGAVEVPVGLLI